VTATRLVHRGPRRSCTGVRAAVAAHPRGTAIVGELSMCSAEFRALWARHDVRESVSGTEILRIQVVLECFPATPGR
jgi:hypothetical protein